MALELCAPGPLPGAGLGNIVSIAELGGLIGLAVTSGAILAEGLSGSIVYGAAAVAVLTAKDDWGGEPAFAFGTVGLLLLLAIVRVLRNHRGDKQGEGA